MAFTMKWARNVAEKYNTNVIVGDNSSIILEGLTTNKGGCPCVPSFARTQDNMCPCKKFREEGECCCGLFESRNQ